MIRPLVLLLAATLLGGAAAERPANLLPTRDVQVTYRATDAQSGQSAVLRISFEAGARRLRVDLPQGEGFMILEPGLRRQVMVMPATQSWVELPPGAFDLPQLSVPADARFSRAGAAVIAGQRCTQWNVQSSDGTGAACLTDDGVILQLQGQREGRQGAMVAQSVSYGHLADALFAPPPGYTRIRVPQIPRGDQ